MKYLICFLSFAVLANLSCHLEELSQVNNCPDPPVAEFTVDQDTCSFPCKVTITNTSKNAIKYEWDFGNGQVSTLSSPPPQDYPTPASYTIRLIVISSNQCRDTFTRHINFKNTFYKILNQYPDYNPIYADRDEKGRIRVVSYYKNEKIGIMCFDSSGQICTGFPFYSNLLDVNIRSIISDNKGGLIISGNTISSTYKPHFFLFSLDNNYITNFTSWSIDNGNSECFIFACDQIDDTLYFTGVVTKNQLFSVYYGSTTDLHNKKDTIFNMSNYLGGYAQGYNIKKFNSGILYLDILRGSGSPERFYFKHNKLSPIDSIDLTKQYKSIRLNQNEVFEWYAFIDIGDNSYLEFALRTTCCETPLNFTNHVNFPYLYSNNIIQIIQRIYKKDNEVALLGYTTLVATSSGTKDIFFSKINKSNQIIFNRIYGQKANNEELAGMIPLDNGGYFIVGSSDGKPLLIKTDNMGNY